MRQLGLVLAYVFLAVCVLLGAAARFYLPVALPLWAGLAIAAAVALAAAGGAPRALPGPIVWAILVAPVWGAFAFWLAVSVPGRQALPYLVYPLAAGAGAGAGLAAWSRSRATAVRRAAYLAACAAAVAGIFFLWTPLAQLGRPPPFRAPAFELPLLGGGRLDSTAFSGKTLVLAFWASWCEPCREELPHLQRLYRGNAGNPRVAIYLVDVGGAGETQANARAFLDRYGIDMPSAYDLNGRLALKFRIDGVLPARVVVGPDGFVRYRSVGYVPGHGSLDGLRAAIAAAARRSVQ